MQTLEQLKEACENSLKELEELVYIREPGYDSEGKRCYRVVAVHRDYEIIYTAYRNVFDLLKVIEEKYHV